MAPETPPVPWWQQLGAGSTVWVRDTFYHSVRGRDVEPTPHLVVKIGRKYATLANDLRIALDTGKLLTKQGEPSHRTLYRTIEQFWDGRAASEWRLGLMPQIKAKLDTMTGTEPEILRALHAVAWALDIEYPEPPTPTDRTT